MAFGDLKGTLEGGNVNTLTSNNATGSVVVSKGDLIYVTFGRLTAPLTAPTCGDNLTNTYTLLNTSDAGILGANSFYSIVADDGGTLTTVTVGTSSTGPDNWVSGVAVFDGPFSTIDRNPSAVLNNGATSHVGPATGALSQTKETVVGWMVADSINPTAGFQWELAVQASTSGIYLTTESRVTAATTSLAPTFASAVSQNASVLGTTSFRASPVAVLVANNFATPQPTFSTPLFAQSQAFGANPLIGTAATASAPAIGQTHVLVANTAKAGAPAFGAVSAFVARVFASPPPLSSGAPIFGGPLIGQSNVLIAEWFPRAPTISAGVLGQKHVLPTALFTKNPPVIGAASFSAGRQLLATGFAVSGPTFTTATFDQNQTLTANGFVVTGPTIGVTTPPLITRILTATNFVNSPPTIATSSAGLSSILLARNLAAGHPLLEPSQIGIIAAPEVWLRHRLKRWSNNPNAEYYDEDGTEDEGPVQQAIFANLNDEIELTLSSLSLVGRTSPGRGPAETLQVEPPLQLSGLLLRLSFADLRQYNNDGEAAAGGIPIGGLYHLGGFLKIRVA